MPIGYGFKSFPDIMWLFYIWKISGVSTKAPKKGKNNEQNERTHIQEDKQTFNRTNHKGDIKFLNQDTGRPPARTPSLNEPSATTIACVKTKIAYTLCNINNTLCL